MKILNILHVPWLAGTEAAFISVSKCIASRKHEIFCMIPENAQAKKPLEEISAIHPNLKLIENNKAYKNFGKFDLTFIHQIKKFVKKHKIDAVIVNNGRNCLIAKKALKGISPVIAMNHGTNVKKTATADYLFSISSSMEKAHIAANMNEKNIFSIPNMIKIDPTLQLNKKENMNVICSIGRFADQKGYDIFLQAIKIIKDKGYNYKYVIGGDGEDREMLQKLRKDLGLDDDVEFSGWVHDKKAFFEKTDLFVLSSRYEPFGIVILEAMKHKTAVVATDCEGPLDIIKDGENGLLVKRLEPESIANGIIRAMGDKELREKMAENGYKTVIENYTDEVVGNKINDALIKITNDFQRKK